MSSDIGKSLPASRRRAPAFAAFAALFGLFAGYAEPARALGIFEALFGIRSQRFEPSYGYYVPPPVRRRVIVKRPRLTIKLASLPPVREMPKVPKDPVVLSDAEIVAGLLADPTLRRGDIVVFPKGPKVFTGAPGSSHSPHDFEDVRSSSAVADSMSIARHFAPSLRQRSSARAVTSADVHSPRRRPA